MSSSCQFEAISEKHPFVFDANTLNKFYEELNTLSQIIEELPQSPESNRLREAMKNVHNAHLNAISSTQKSPRKIKERKRVTKKPSLDRVISAPHMKKHGIQRTESLVVRNTKKPNFDPPSRPKKSPRIKSPGKHSRQASESSVVSTNTTNRPLPSISSDVNVIHKPATPSRPPPAAPIRKLSAIPPANSPIPPRPTVPKPASPRTPTSESPSVSPRTPPTKEPPATPPSKEPPAVSPRKPSAVPPPVSPRKKALSNPPPVSPRASTVPVNESPIASPRKQLSVENVKNENSSPRASPRLTKTEQAAATAELDMFSKGGQVWKRKKKKKTASAWKQRYFLLKGGKITYYGTVHDVKPLGEINLVVTQIMRINAGKDYKYVFKMTSYDREYHIATETEEDLLQWINMINRVKEHIFEHGLELQENIAKPKQAKSLKKSVFGTLGRKKSNTATLAISGSAGNFQSTQNSGNGITGLAAVLDEIVTTERDYVNDLRVVRDLYIKKLEDYGLMQRDQKDAIFGNIEGLIPLHEDLLEKLEKEYKSKTPDFGKVFEEICPNFTVYSNYCTSQSSAAEVIEEYATQNPNFGLCLEELKTDDIAKGLDLSDYLIKPMQRICKYPLLLRELLKETPETNPCRSNIQNAMSDMEQYLNNINESKRTVDNLMDLMAVQELIDKQLNLQNVKGRSVLGSKEFRKVTLDQQSPIKARIWILSDMILICRKKDKKDEKYLFRAKLPTKTCVVWDLDPQGTAPPDKRNGFSIVNTDKESDVTQVVIIASSPEEKAECVELVNSAIGSLV